MEVRSLCSLMLLETKAIPRPLHPEPMSPSNNRMMATLKGEQSLSRTSVPPTFLFSSMSRQAGTLWRILSRISTHTSSSLAMYAATVITALVRALGSMMEAAPRCSSKKSNTNHPTTPNATTEASRARPSPLSIKVQLKIIRNYLNSVDISNMVS